MEFILDCSVAIAWCFEDEKNGYADAVLESLTGNQILVPNIWTLEILNVFLGAERKKRIQQADIIRFIELFNHLPILEDEEPVRRRQEEIFSIGQKYSLSSYDAAYLELAMRQGLPLATLDTALIRACRESGCEHYLASEYAAAFP